MTPIFGVLFFIILYFVATFFYPGGSQIDENSIGFSWIDNYWCNLLNETTINGQLNPAKPIAITGMLVLSLSLSFFGFLFTQHTSLDKTTKVTIQITGCISLITSFFLITDIDHDLITNLASAFGITAIIGIFIGLYKIRWHSLFLFGFLNILLVGLNNYVYYDKRLIVHLPLIQKVTFAVFLTWICCIDLKLYQLIIVNNKKIINLLHP